MIGPTARPPGQRTSRERRTLRRETAAPVVDIVIEVPRWSCIKRGPGGHIDFVSPCPCPVNYGSVPDRIGLEGDLLDAVVVGPRLPRGTRLRLPARGAIGLAERGLYDDKLICCERPLSASERRRLVIFFHLYATAKRLLNLLRGEATDGGCTGWGDAIEALDRSAPRSADHSGPRVRF